MLLLFVSLIRRIVEKQMKNRSFKLLILLAIVAVATLSLSFRSEAAGWDKRNGKWTYSDDSGMVRDRWMYLNMNWYYFDSNGYMATGLRKIKGKLYYFAPTTKGAWREGMRMYGWQLVDGKFMYFSFTSGQHIPDNRHEVGSIKGIDVSVYQGDMDWHAVKNQGIEFTFIRIGHGDHNLDTCFQKNMLNAGAAGIKTGIYFYSTAMSPEQSRDDARWVIQQLRGFNVNYPVALDMEENSVAALGKERVTNIARAFLEEIRAAGYTPMIYSNENWAINFIDLNKLPGVYRWIARYNGSYDETIRRDIWQAGSTTLLNGINVNSVDIDFCYTDFSRICTPRVAPSRNYYRNRKGWHKTSLGIWYDNGDGTFPSDEWKKISGKTYFFDEMGYVVRDTWKLTNSGTYYLGKNGVRYENKWLIYNGKKYYFRADGRMATGWTNIGNDTCFMNSDGSMHRGWLHTAGKNYYINEMGQKLENCWLRINGSEYYLRRDGSAATGPTRIGKETYFFMPNGKLAKDMIINGYITDEDGIIIDREE